MKTKLELLGIITLLVLLSLALLVRFTKLPNGDKNGFVRNLTSQTLHPIRQYFTSAPLKKICGLTNSSLFIEVENPQWSVRTNLSLSKWDTVLAMPLTLRDALVTTHSLVIDSPNTYLFANNAIKIFHHKLFSTGADSIKVLTNLFSRSLYISSNTSIIRTFTSNLQDQIFQKINMHTGQSVNEAQIIQTGHRSGVNTDGFFCYDKAHSRIFYITYFTKYFWCIDTNLNVIYKGITVDNSNLNDSEVSVFRLPGLNKIQPAKAQISVNNNSFVYRNTLYVASDLRADNETPSGFRDNSVIDRYDISTGKYLTSFYIPNEKGEKLKSFAINNDTLVALYPSAMAAYTFPNSF